VAHLICGENAGASGIEPVLSGLGLRPENFLLLPATVDVLGHARIRERASMIYPRFLVQIFIIKLLHLYSCHMGISRVRVHHSLRASMVSNTRAKGTPAFLGKHVSQSGFISASLYDVPLPQYAMANDALLLYSASISFAAVSFSAGYPAPGKEKPGIVPRKLKRCCRVH